MCLNTSLLLNNAEQQRRTWHVTGQPCRQGHEPLETPIHQEFSSKPNGHLSRLSVRRPKMAFFINGFIRGFNGGAEVINRTAVCGSCNDLASFDVSVYQCSIK